MNIHFLDEILEKIDENEICVRIDKPIDECLYKFPVPTPENPTPGDVQNHITNFYKYIRLHGMHPTSIFSDAQASTETIWLLESNYKGWETSGYEGFLFDFIHCENENRQVMMERFLTILKYNERKKYLSFVFKSKLDSLVWKQKCDLTNELLIRYNYILPPDLLILNTFQLIPYLNDLLVMVSASLDSDFFAI